MNKIINQTNIVLSKPEMGDIYISQRGQIYLLCYVGKFVCVSLDDGNWWSVPQDKAAEAVEDLIFLKKGATITIS